MVCGRGLNSSLKYSLFSIILVYFILQVCVQYRENNHVNIINVKLHRDSTTRGIRYVIHKQSGRAFFSGRISYSTNGTSCYHLHRLVLSGDVYSNPGPITTKHAKHICKEGERIIRKNQKAVSCATCQGWSNMKCLVISKEVVVILTTGLVRFVHYPN
jgi:hypothetical protein